MATLEVDFDVFKALTALRETEATTYNDVIRKLLNLPAAAGGLVGPAATAGWVQKGVTFPDGTKFRAVYKGVTYLGEVQNGRMKVNGRPVKSLSDAAHRITRTTVNGWCFWHCRLPNATEYVLANSLKK